MADEIILAGQPNLVSLPTSVPYTGGTNPASMPAADLGSDEPSEFARILTAAVPETYLGATFYEHLVDTVALVADNLTAAARVRWRLGAAGSIQQPETLTPDGLPGKSNIIGSEVDVDDDPDAPDGSWITAVDPTLDTDVRLTMTAPASASAPAPTTRWFGCSHGPPAARPRSRSISGKTAPPSASSSSSEAH